jgi:uncharacterized membrane protein YvbJ
MPQTKACPDCGNQVSTRATICPKCGRKRPHANPVIWPAIGIGFVVLVVVMGVCLAFAVMMG